MTSSFDRFLHGDGCPLCPGRPDSNETWDFVAKLGVSSLYLNKNQTYRGHCQLIFDVQHAARPDQVTAEEWAAFSDDLHRAQGVIQQVTGADHVNLESLGNMVPHLHWHIAPRYRDDVRWGSPIWLTDIAEMKDTRLEEKERSALIRALRDGLK
jgi:diadenosine tetraphosphate (Ap4A) HIT family hydrolase